MDLMAQTQEEVNKAPPPKPDVPTVFDLVQREQEIKLLDVKDKQVIDVSLADISWFSLKDKKEIDFTLTDLKDV